MCHAFVEFRCQSQLSSLHASPNKWRIEVHPNGNVWKEWGLAKDEFGQHLYMERWERLEGGGGTRRLALRRRMTSTGKGDGLLILLFTPGSDDGDSPRCLSSSL